MPDSPVYYPNGFLFKPNDPAILRAKLRALYFNFPQTIRPAHPDTIPLATVYLTDQTTALIHPLHFQGQPANPWKRTAQDNTYWLDVATTGVTAYDYLTLNGSWVLYVDNTDLIFHTTPPGGTTTTVPSSVTLTVDANNEVQYTPPTA